MAAVGEVPLEWYEDETHIGYDREGRKVAKGPRRDKLDALLARNGLTFALLPQHAVVGTSSLRRQAQLRALRPDLRLEELRGNLDTRLRKLDAGEYDAILLAVAGLNLL